MFDDILSRLPGIKQASAAQWSKAAAALAAGDAGLMATVLRNLDLPVALADVFRVALSEAANLEAAIKADGAEELQQLQAELSQLHRMTTSTLAEASKRAERLLQVEKAIPLANNRALAAEYGRGQLSALRTYFPELFGLPGTGIRMPSGGQLPGEVHNVLVVSFGMNPYKQSWREFIPAAPPAPPRKVRVPYWNKPRDTDEIPEKPF